VSGLWTSAFSFGSFLGPTIGGSLVDWLGFTGATAILQGWSSVMLIIDVFVLCSKLGGQNGLELKNKGNRERYLYQRIE
jgi:MFS family permease